MKKLSLSTAVMALAGSLMLFSSSVYATCAGQGCWFGTEPWCTCENGQGSDKEDTRDQEEKAVIREQ